MSCTFAFILFPPMESRLLPLFLYFWLFCHTLIQHTYQHSDIAAFIINVPLCAMLVISLVVSYRNIRACSLVLFIPLTSIWLLSYPYYKSSIRPLQSIPGLHYHQMLLQDSSHTCPDLHHDLSVPIELRQLYH